nr:MAG TPA: hypothetical protein [Caudoviricetes sp.]
METIRTRVRLPPAPQLPTEGTYGSSRDASEKGCNV